MIPLTPEQWRVLTYVQRHWQRWQCAPKLSDIKTGCAFELRRDALHTLQALQGMGLLRLKMRSNGSPVWSVVSGAMVGVEP